MKKIDEGRRVHEHIKDRIDKKVRPSIEGGALNKSKLGAGEKDPEPVAGKIPSTKGQRKNKHDSNNTAAGRAETRRRQAGRGGIHENRFEEAAAQIILWRGLSTKAITERANKLSNLRPIIAVLDKFIEEKDVNSNKFVTMRQIMQCIYEDKGDIFELMAAANDENGRNVAQKMALEEARLFRQYYPNSVVWVECKCDVKSNMAKYYARAYRDDSVFNESLNEGYVIKKII